ncbi:MAG: ABC transporter permease subunit, partial [Clostridiales bacterium]|nr:ABC transporter permease subunit [Clostridiales bacterium]
TFVFCYLPLAGWSYAFFDYKAGIRLFDNPFVGFKHFQSLFANPVIRADIARVMKNTIGMSLIGIGTSWLPMFVAIFLAEIGSGVYRKIVQTVTTIPYFISWILVYSLAYAMFSTEDGFVNKLLISLGLADTGANFLLDSSHMWLKMWLYSTWKGLGWSAIMYIASIAGIDHELYEAAAIDGATRMQRIWHVTVPSLLPAFFVLLLLAIANLINNGMDLYFVFQNAMNKEYIEVLDLYVYNKGIMSSSISFSTAVSAMKSIVSLTLLFVANFGSKLLRGESIF